MDLVTAAGEVGLPSPTRWLPQILSEPADRNHRAGRSGGRSDIAASVANSAAKTRAAGPRRPPCRGCAASERGIVAEIIDLGSNLAISLRPNKRNQHGAPLGDIKVSVKTLAHIANLREKADDFLR